MILKPARTLGLLISALAPRIAQGQAALPTLRYDPPANSYRSAATPPRSSIPQ